jgi:superoxide dismutase, Fe-Mn family
MTRRQAIKTTALASVALATLPGTIAQINPTEPAAAPEGPFTLPSLPYAHDALEPFIDTETMHIHHDKHHAAYVANLNKALLQSGPFGPGGWNGTDDTWLNHALKYLNSLPENICAAVRNNGGGHYNHSLFWQMMKPGGGGEPTGDLARAIDAGFGSFGAFKEKFVEAATKVFGSGWTWLVADGSALKIETTTNQDTPLSSGRAPLLGFDVWEHAYYLKHQNRRADYITAWWNVVNWDFVSGRCAKFKA